MKYCLFRAPTSIYISNAVYEHGSLLNLELLSEYSLPIFRQLLTASVVRIMFVGVLVKQKTISMFTCNFWLFVAVIEFVIELT